MVNPIYIFGIAIGIAFLFNLIDKTGRKISIFVLIATLGFFLYVSICYMLHFAGGKETVEIFTAGFKPPYSINLQLGLYESVFISMINATGFLSGLYLIRKFQSGSIKSMVLFLMAIMGLNGIVMTRDLFNLFVFIEVSSIAIYALVSLDENDESYAAGFKYMIAGSFASVFLLIGTIYLYRYSGTLNLNGISALTAGKIGGVAIFFLFMALFIELKPFPANGWALDVYESTNPAIAALLSGASIAAAFFALYKILSIFGGIWYNVTLWIGILTFLGSNLYALKQSNAQRTLGYSSLGQVGFLFMILGMTPILKDDMPYILFGILITHFFAKTGLFWMSGLVKGKNQSDWSQFKNSRWMLFFMGTFFFALVGLPPFPSFFAKWSLILKITSMGKSSLAVIILVGSFIEAIYLFRWLGYAVKLENPSNSSNDTTYPKTQILPIIVSMIGLYFFGIYTEKFYNSGISLDYLPLFIIFLFFLLDFLPNRIKAIFAIFAIGYYTYLTLPGQSGLPLIFNSIFLVGGVITLIATFATKGKRPGYFPLAMIMFLGLSGLTTANNMLSFFIAWEFMTIGSYLLILRGKKAMPHALSYILFSLGGAYFILLAFSLAVSWTVKDGLIIQNALLLSNLSLIKGWLHPIVWSLAIVGFLTKAAGFGLHIWLPGAHSEAESDVSPLVSAILLKAGIFGMMLIMIHMGGASIPFGKTGLSLNYLLGWVGAITAVIGTIGALFQEDAKRLLAYSSIGQLGYIIFGVALMTKFGWILALLYTVIHFLYKSTLFLGVGGMYARTHTKNMYEMGGLIKKMPFTFASILIAIISLAGIPPLIGFAGKWMTYNSVLEKAWYFQGIMVLFAGFAAFLYCYRILFGPFLGQPKDHLRNVKEASIFMLIPQYIFVGILLYLSISPEFLFQYFSNTINQFPALSGETLQWTNHVARTSYGYWNPVMIMTVVGSSFILILIWLYYWVHNTHKVKQFNIVYSGESPYLPETTHYSHNFFAPYRKAMGFLYALVAEKFWEWISDTVHTISDQARRVYTGNGQTYALHILIFMIVIYMFVMGGF